MKTNFQKTVFLVFLTFFICISVSAQQLSVNATANPNTICEGQQSQLNALVTGGTGNNSYSWVSNPPGFTSNIANPTVNPSITTTYTVTVNDGVTTTSDDIIVTVNPLPTADAGPDVTICSGDCTNLTALGGGSGASYLWSNTATTAIINVCPTALTTYTVTVTNTCGSDSDSVNVFVNSSPTVNIGGDTTLCKDAGPIVIFASVLGSPVEYMWSTGETKSWIAVNPSTTTIYTVTVTDTNGCTASDDMTYNVNPLPAISGLTDVCVGSTITLSSTGTGGTWSSSAPGVATVDNSGVVTGVSAGSTNITHTDANGCISLAYAVTVNLKPVISGLNEVCEGSTITLSSTGSGGTWSSSAPGVATVDNSGVVTGISAGSTNITHTDANGCVSLAYAITIDPSPKFSITPLDGDCPCINSNWNRYEVSPDDPNSDYSYSWQKPNNGDTLKTWGDTLCNIRWGDAGNIGWVRVTVTDSLTGCFKTDSLEVTICQFYAPDAFSILDKPGPGCSEIWPQLLVCPYPGYEYMWFMDYNKIPRVWNEEPKYWDEQYYQPSRINQDSIECEKDYTVLVIDGNGCKTMSVPFRFDCPPVKSIMFEPTDIFSIFPNPSNGSFTVLLNFNNLPQNIESYTYRILDLTGKEVCKEQMSCCGQEIEITGINKGIYFFEVHVSSRYFQIKKILIN